MGSEKLTGIIDQIGGLTVLELSELVKNLEEKFGVTAAVAVAAPVTGAGSAGGAEAPPADEVDVILVSAGEKKIQVLKAVREITGLGLKEAKDLVDGAPKVVKEKLKRAEAEEIRKKIEAEGGKVEIK